MDLMEQLRDKARANVQKVAFFEADDPKMIGVVSELTREGLAECQIVGDEGMARNICHNPAPQMRRYDLSNYSQ